MNVPENSNPSLSELKNLLGLEKWNLYQLNSNQGGNSETKLLFKDLPGMLIIDFFQNNVINKLENFITANGRIDLWATGLDDVMWEYRILQSTFGKNRLDR